AQLDPFELAPGAPAARLAGAPPAGLEPGEHRRKLALLLRAEAGAVADDVELAGLVVEPEDEGADGALVLARPPADDHAVDRPHPLDLRHPAPLAGQVRRGGLLRDDPLTLVEPLLRVGSISGERGERDPALGEELEPAAPLGERQLEQRL